MGLKPWKIRERPWKKTWKKHGKPLKHGKNMETHGKTLRLPIDFFCAPTGWSASLWPVNGCRFARKVIVPPGCTGERGNLLLYWEHFSLVAISTHFYIFQWYCIYTRHDIVCTISLAECWSTPTSSGIVSTWFKPNTWIHPNGYCCGVGSCLSCLFRWDLKCARLAKFCLEGANFEGCQARVDHNEVSTKIQPFFWGCFPNSVYCQ